MPSARAVSREIEESAIDRKFSEKWLTERSELLDSFGKTGKTGVFSAGAAEPMPLRAGQQSGSKRRPVR